MFKDKWYYSTWFIVILMFLWPFILPLAAAISLMVVQIIKRNEVYDMTKNLKPELIKDLGKLETVKKELTVENENLLNKNNDLKTNIEINTKLCDENTIKLEEIVNKINLNKQKHEQIEKFQQLQKKFRKTY
ncbi:hypothetical protein [Geomicrobium sp. JCM 19039]|uniref:hypothetical protein n=1 Tax=Geomicrobium sp. JCM 19039 TaxID=1460636 RepID=UPI00045F19B7|nr:hypothetical protein [Geomicrobium sp. JCM 19039]GAK11355.1 hypothetical protein JCM19039_1044 [Geomicrobium sp. JCM 19039]